jgi:hypothetical protein
VSYISLNSLFPSQYAGTLGRWSTCRTPNKCAHTVTTCVMYVCAHEPVTGVFYHHHHLQVCKNQEKTKKKKEALSPTGAIDPHTGYMQMVSPEDVDDYPVPQVRATRAPLQPMRFDDVREKHKSKAPYKPNSKNDDSAGTLPRVASTSTVLAPIGAKTGYVGPALLRSRKTGLKRSRSSENFRDDGNENLKKPRSEPSALSGHGSCPFYFRAFSSRIADSIAAFTARRTAPFRVPFKVPFNTVSVDPQTTSRIAGPTCDKTKPLREPDGALVATIELVDDGGEESPPCGSASFQSRLKCEQCVDSNSSPFQRPHLVFQTMK